MLVVFCIAHIFALSVAAQSSPGSESVSASPAICSFHHLDRCALDVVRDQGGIWTSPLHATHHDLIWLVPFGGAVGASLAYDTDTLEKVGTSKSRIDFGRHVSTAGSPYVYFGTSGLLYITGVATKNPHIQETGRLGGEALINAVILNEVLKLATQRDRPFQGNGQGNFWPHGTKNFNFDASMPSAHATAAWAFAKVVSSEYPDRPILKVLVYGAATTVSVSRVLARDHFPSDVVVGSTFGYLVGAYVVRHHSDEYQDFAAAPFYEPSGQSAGLALSIPPNMTSHLCARLKGQVGRWFGKGHQRESMPQVVAQKNVETGDKQVSEQSNPHQPGSGTMAVPRQETENSSDGPNNQ